MLTVLNYFYKIAWSFMSDNSRSRKLAVSGSTFQNNHVKQKVAILHGYK